MIGRTMERPLTIREEANALTCYAFRDGYFEQMHAGKPSVLLEKPGFSRISDDGMRKIMIGISACLAELLELKETDAEKYWKKLVPFHDAYCQMWEK